MNEITNYLNQLKKEQLLKDLSFPAIVILSIIFAVKFSFIFIGVGFPLIIVGGYTIANRQRYYRFLKSMHRVNNSENFKAMFEELFYEAQKQDDKQREDVRTKGINKGINRRNKRHLRTFDYVNITLELKALRHIKGLLDEYKPEKKEEDQFDDFFEGYSNTDDYDSFQ